jgi:O-antigen biosynthesis protein
VTQIIVEGIADTEEHRVVDTHGIKELVPVHIEASAEVLDGRRINLIVPSLDFMRTFGGITTALRLVKRLSPMFDAVRIIATYQKHSEIDSSEWVGWTTDRDIFVSRSIIGIGDRTTPVSVLEGDVFLATGWPTALYARNVIERQVELFPGANRRFVYFIQDYEPGFYPWSVQLYYAESTYRRTQDTIAVFNSRRLAEFFRNRGVQFSKEFVLEPLMHPQLRETRRATLGRAKERLIYVYTRPAISRNGFDLTIDALRLWARSFPGAQEWSVVSFGGQHEDISLGESAVLRSIGKVSMQRYGDYLSRSWAGLSFQFMAHPSYSRLEMAEFGAWVITNKLENNDLSDLAPNILCVDEPSPQAVAAKLSWCCGQYGPGLSAVLGNLPAIFEDREDEFPNAEELVSTWRDASGVELYST